MSVYVNSLQLHAKNALDMELRRRDFVKEIPKEVRAMAGLIKRIFEDEIIPAAHEIGYEVGIRDRYGDVRNWEDLREDTFGYLIENYLTALDFGIMFYLAKGRKTLNCDFILGGNPPEVNIEVGFIYKGQNLFGLGNLPETPNDKPAWKKFFTERELFGRRKITGNNMFEKFEKIMSEYEEFPEEVLENQIKR